MHTLLITRSTHETSLHSYLFKCLCALACILTDDMVLCMHATHNIFKTVAKVASLCSLLQIGVGGAPWVRLTPSNATAEVTSSVLVVALTAQRCRLTITPALRRDSVGCTAIVAEPSCPEPAVNAWHGRLKPNTDPVVPSSLSSAVHELQRVQCSAPVVVVAEQQIVLNREH